MKYCKKCGAQIEDESVVCVHCGCAVDVPANNAQPSTVQTVAKVFMILGCIVSAFYFLIPLCWTIPMTVKYCRSIEQNQPVSTAFKICSLLFVNLVAGILMLCDNGESQNNKY